MSHQDDLVARAARALPGGVLSSHRYGPGHAFVVRAGVDEAIAVAARTGGPA